MATFRSIKELTRAHQQGGKNGSDCYSMAVFAVTVCSVFVEKLLNPTLG